MKLSEIKFNELFDKKLLLEFQQVFAERYPDATSIVHGYPPSLSLTLKSRRDGNETIDVTIKFSRRAAADIEAHVRSTNEELDTLEPYHFSEMMSGEIKLYVDGGTLNNGDDYELCDSWEAIAQRFCDELDEMLAEL